MLPYVIFCFPETKGLSLEEVGALFNDELAMDVTNLPEDRRQELDDNIAKTTDLVHFDAEKAVHNVEASAVATPTDKSSSEHVE